MIKEKIGFIGAGNMAFALATAFCAGNSKYAFCLYDIAPENIRKFHSICDDIIIVDTPIEVCKQSRVTFLTIKPQVMDAVLSQIKDANGLLVSVAAGIRLEKLEKALPKARVIRVMPNTPCLIGEMAAAYSSGSRVKPKDIDLCDALLTKAGLILPLQEELMDAVTGLSGSGPAFFAYIAQSFIDAGVKVGIPADKAAILTLRTMKGTAALLEKKKLSCQELIKMVSSPNGTTVAGRKVLESSSIRETIKQTVEKASIRSRELSK